MAKKKNQQKPQNPSKERLPSQAASNNDKSPPQNPQMRKWLYKKVIISAQWTINKVKNKSDGKATQSIKAPSSDAQSGAFCWKDTMRLYLFSAAGGRRRTQI